MQTIYLSNEDTVDIIVGKIKSSQEKEINLVVLSRTLPVLSVTNLKMFRRIAENLNKIVTVSTVDEAVKILVENSGISLKTSEKKESLEKSKFSNQTSDNIYSQKPRLVDSISLSKGSIDLSSRREFPKKQELVFTKEVISQKEEKRFNDFNENSETVEEELTKFQVPKTSRNIFIGFIIMVIIAVGVAGYVLLPSAKIVITPKANPINTNFDFIIDKNIKELNIEEKIIPATLITVTNIEKEEQFIATGKKQITSNATGTVTIYNEFSSFPQKLIESTRLATADGKIFKTTKSIIVPGFVRDENGSDVPGKIDVSIVASESGPSYNIDPSDFTIPGFKGTAKYVKIYAKSLVATSGGSSGFTTVISADDFKKAKDFLEEEAKKNIIAQLNDKKPSDLVMIDQAISIKSGELISQLGIDQPTNKFKASVKVSAVAFLFDPNDVKDITKSILREINAEKKNLILVDAGIDYGDAKIIGTDKIKMSAQSHANAYNSYGLVDESAKNDLQGKIVGKNREDLEAYIKNDYPDINKVSVTLWPFWVAKIPTIEKNVSISLDIPHEE